MALPLPRKYYTSHCAATRREYPDCLGRGFGDPTPSRTENRGVADHCLTIWLWDQVSRHFTSNGLMHSVPDEPPWCQGLLLTARDLVFGVIDFGLYYTLLTNLYFVRFGTRGRIQTYDLPLRRRLLLFAELLGHMSG